MSRDWHGAGQPRGFPQQQRGGPPQQMQPQQYMQQQMQPPNQQQMQQQMQQPYQQMQQQMYPPQMQPRQGYAPPQMQMQPPMQMHDPFSAQAFGSAPLLRSDARPFVPRPASAPRRSPKRRGASQPPAAARQPEMYDPYAAYSIDDYAPPEDAPSVSSVEQALAAALREKKQQVSPDAGQLALKAAQDTMRQIAADLAQKRSLQQQPAAAEKLASAAPPLVASEPSPVVAAPPASQSEDHGAFRAAAMADVGEAVSTPPEAVSTPPVRSNGPGLQKKRLPPALPPLSAVGPKRTRLVAVEEDAAGKSVFDGLLAVGPIAAEPPKEPVPPVPPAARAPPINAPGFAAAAVAKVAAPPAAAAPATPPVEAPAEAAPPANAEMDALLGPAAPTEPVAETQMDVEAPHEVPRVEAPRVDEAPVDEAARAQPPQKEAKAECGDVRPMDDAEAPADCDTMALDSAADSFALDYTPNAAPSDATATSDTHVASEADAEDASPEPDDAGDAAMSDDVEPTADGVEPAAENVVADSTEAASDAPSACVAAAEPFSGADGAPEGDRPDGRDAASSDGAAPGEAASEGRASTGLWADLEDELLDRAPASHEEEALDDAFSAVIGGRDLEPHSEDDDAPPADGAAADEAESDEGAAGAPAVPLTALEKALAALDELRAAASCNGTLAARRQQLSSLAALRGLARELNPEDMQSCDCGLLAELRRSSDRIVATSARAVRHAWKDAYIAATSPQTTEPPSTTAPTTAMATAPAALAGAPEEAPAPASAPRLAEPPAEALGIASANGMDEVLRLREMLREAKKELAAEKAATTSTCKSLRTNFNESRKLWAAEKDKLTASAARADRAARETSTRAKAAIEAANRERDSTLRRLDELRANRCAQCRTAAQQKTRPLEPH